jgi:hypothetical protein
MEGRIQYLLSSINRAKEDCARNILQLEKQLALLTLIKEKYPDVKRISYNGFRFSSELCKNDCNDVYCERPSISEYGDYYEDDYFETYLVTEVRMNGDLTPYEVLVNESSIVRVDSYHDEDLLSSLLTAKGYPERFISKAVQEFGYYLASYNRCKSEDKDA